MSEIAIPEGLLCFCFVSTESGKIEFGDFCGILARTIKESDPETELEEAFKVTGVDNLLKDDIMFDI